MDDAHGLSILAPSETAGANMAAGTHGGLPNTDSTAFFPTGLHEFLRRARWKAYQRPVRQSAVGNYLDTI